MKRAFLLAGAWMSFALGLVGVFVPVLPTTPLILLATFLFAKSSPRWHAWVTSTKVYKRYVEAFKQAGGIPLATKLRALGVSLGVMGLSAFLVQKPVVWAILACCALFVSYYILVRVPTVNTERVRCIREMEIEAE